MAGMSMEEINTYHRIDREMYVRLVFSLNREPIQSMQVIALWLWLEQMGFPNIILKMSSLSDSVVIIVVDEALACLNCLGYGFTPMSTTTADNNSIPMTQNLLETRFSLQFIRENRFQAFAGISKTVNEVCIAAFGDIAQEAMAVQAPAPHRNITTGGSDQNQVGNMMLSYPAPSVGHRVGLFRPVYQHPLIGSPPPAPLLRGTSQSHYLSPQRPHFGFSGMGSGSQQPNVESNSISDGRSNLNQQPQPMWNPNEDFIIPPEDRSMFVTFSRGHPMRDWEIRDFFTRMYGNCIEEIHMEEVPPNKQSMYARVLFNLPSKITEILEGEGKAKFTINGKNVWVRRYVSRRA